MGKDTVQIISATPTLDTSAYASGDLMCGITTLANVFDIGGGVLHSVVVKDKDAQAGAFDIVLIESSTLPGSTLTLNAAFAPADADLDSILGVVNITGADYASWSANALATKTSIGLLLAPKSSEKNLYFVLVSKDAKTYSASGLILDFGVLRD